MKSFLQASEVKVFAKNPNNMTEYSEAWQSFRDKMDGFLAKNLTLDACRKFFMCRTLTFWLYKTFSKITRTQCTSNRVYMMHSREHLIVNWFSYHFRGVPKIPIYQHVKINMGRNILIFEKVTCNLNFRINPAENLWLN